MTRAAPRRSTVIAVLGTAQTLAWGSSYYLAALLAAPMAQELGMREPTVFLAFSLALVVSALIGPWAGRTIDRHGGRQVLMGTNLLFAAGLAGLGLAQGPWTHFTAWVVLGLAMGSGLYEAAFATLVRLYGQDSRNAITGITLIAGFASTVAWPLTAWMDAHYGWRGACFGWAALHLVLGLPLNAWLPRVAMEVASVPEPAATAASNASASTSSPPTSSSSLTSSSLTSSSLTSPAPTPPAPAPSTAPQPSGTQPQPQPPALTSALLAFVFAVAWFTSTAMAAHLPRLMQALGASLTVAVAVGALVGPAQVVGRLLEFGVLRRVHPLLSARLATLTHPVGAVCLLFAGPVFAPAFAMLHGAGNGILTIAKGTLPLVFFGPQGYGARQGWLMLPGRMAQAFAPFAFGLALDHWGAASLWLSTGLGLAAFVALMVLRAVR